MTTAEFNRLTADLYDRLPTIETLDDAGWPPKPQWIVESRPAQEILKYFYTKLVVEQAREPGFTGLVLSPRQIAIVRLLGEGLSNAEIARRVLVKVGTVKTYLHLIAPRIGCKNRWQIGIWAREHSGWLAKQDTLNLGGAA